MAKKIAVTGPESTGKTALAQQMAKMFNATWVPEYAREYLININRPYTAEDLDIIAENQIKTLEKAQNKETNLIIADTELLVIKIWYEHAFKKCPQWILEALEKQKFDLYLLCYVDIPWSYDPLREHPHLRSYFYGQYKKELKTRGWPFAVVAGNGSERINNAADLIKKAL